MNTKDFAEVLMTLLSLMPPEGSFCKIVKGLAETDAYDDKNEAIMWQDKDTWGEDLEKLTKELTDKFGADIDFKELYAEWEKQAAKAQEKEAAK